MPEKILLYGDGEIWYYWPVLYFPDEGIVCDFSECGLYVCSGVAKRKKTAPKKATWLEAVEDLIGRYGENMAVEAYNNRIAWELREHGIKTLGDLKRYIEERK